MQKRIITLLFAVVFLFCGIVGRLSYIILFNNDFVNNDYNSYSILIDSNDENIFFSDLTLITNNKSSYVAVILPSSKCINELDKIFSYNEKRKIIEELKQGYPIVRNINKKYDTKYIKILDIKKTQTSLKQFVSKESNGLLSYINCNKEQKLRFNLDANGRMLQGDNGTLVDHNYNSKGGILTTFDSNVQSILNKASINIKSGCVVVMDTSSGDVLGIVNKPNEIYINKAFEQYSVGSVFKLVVSACAIENDIDLKYNCTGSIKVGDTNFNCSKNTSHGYQNHKQALANSCNCYFVNLIQKIGKDKILQTAESLGFLDKTTIYNNWRINNSIFPSSNNLASLGELSMLGFGQGRFTSTPLQICSTLCTLSDGYYKKTRIIDGKVNENGIRTINKIESKNKVLSSNTVEKMKEYMRYVVSDGTGYNAESSNNLSSGKTATAETGQYIFGEQQYNTWFAGLYPYNKPKYAIVVMCENGKSGAEDCCPIYRTVVEMIDQL